MAGDSRKSNNRVSANIAGKGVTLQVTNRYQQIIDGTLKISDLDDEEIFRGRLRDKNGGFTGRHPLAIPTAFHDAVVRELIKRAHKKMEAQVEPMIIVLQEIAANPRTPADARYKAATYLMERVLGKVPDRQIVTATIAKWEQDLTSLVVDISDEEIDEIEEYDDPAPVPTQPKRRTGGRHEDVLQG